MDHWIGCACLFVLRWVPPHPDLSSDAVSSWPAMHETFLVVLHVGFSIPLTMIRTVSRCVFATGYLVWQVHKGHMSN